MWKRATLAAVLALAMLAPGAQADVFTVSPMGGSGGGGGGTGCTPTGGAATNIVLYGAGGLCSPATLANVNGGILSLGTLNSAQGSLSLFGSASGTASISGGTNGTFTSASPFALSGNVAFSGGAIVTGGAFNGTLGATTPSTVAATTVSASGQITSTATTGTAPLVIASTTNVPNLNASSLNGATFAAPGAIGSGTASTGAFTTLSATGQFTSTQATGSAPFVVASTTNVANLNASSLSGATFASPGPIGSTAASTGAFTTLSASSTVSGTGFSTYLASPPSIGSSTPAAGAFTTLSASSTVSGAGITALFASPPGIGTTAAGIVDATTMTVAHVFLSGVGNAFSGGPSITSNAMLFNTGSTGYTNTSSSALIYIANNDGVNSQTTAGGNFATLTVHTVIGPTAVGTHQGIASIASASGATTQVRGNYVGLSSQGLAQAAASDSPVAQGFPPQAWPGDNFNQVSGYNGGIWGGVDQAVSTNAPYWWGLTGREVDLFYDTNLQNTLLKTGIGIVDTSPTAFNAKISNDAITFAGTPGFNRLLAFGSETDDIPLPSTGSLMAVQRRLYGGFQAGHVTFPGFLYGVDLRQGVVTAGGAAFASHNFAADSVGAVFGNGLTTNGMVQAETATLTGVTINADNATGANTGGVYPTFPSFAVDAPPSGGTTATVVTASMVGNSIATFGSTGANFANSDVLTIASGQGLVGTGPTFTVPASSGVDGNGGILSLVISNVSASVTTRPPNPVLLTGGLGTGAWVNIVWTQNSGGIFTALLTSFAATGINYVVNDVITPTSITGDTGTQGTYTVTSVTAQGAILPGLTLASAGSMTALASASPPFNRVFTSSPSGSGRLGGQVQPGYSVNTVTITNAGTGYLPEPLPIINTSTNANETLYQAASMTAVMTAATATLTLNPSGGAIKVGAPTGSGPSTGDMDIAGLFKINGVALPTLAGTQTWTAPQTFTNSDMILLGSSTGTTTFASANAGASNFTLTIPALTSTLAELGATETFTAPQSNSPTTLSISTATFTPNATSNIYYATLVHASCPCTIANPSTMPANAALLELWITQSATGSDTIGTWGTFYKFPGGTKPTLSTAASAIDMVSCRVTTSTTIDCVSAAGAAGAFQ